MLLTLTHHLPPVNCPLSPWRHPPLPPYGPIKRPPTSLSRRTSAEWSMLSDSISAPPIHYLKLSFCARHSTKSHSPEDHPCPSMSPLPGPGTIKTFLPVTLSALGSRDASPSSVCPCLRSLTVCPSLRFIFLPPTFCQQSCFSKVCLSPASHAFRYRASIKAVS